MEGVEVTLTVDAGVEDAQVKAQEEAEGQLCAKSQRRSVIIKKTLTLIGLFVLALLAMTRPAKPAMAAEPTPIPPVTTVAGQAGNPFSILCCDAFSPTTASDSSSAPTIIFTNPSVGARHVPTHTLTSATFSEDMDPGTLNSSTFFVSQGTAPLVGSVSYIAVSRVAVFHPDAPLALNSPYTATVTTGARGLSGEPLAENVVWTFTTTDGTSPFSDGMRVYFGDLHNHSGYSDGEGTPADAFATARANGLDFFALTDHSNQLTAEEWQDVRDQANAAAIGGQFVGLRGFEFTHPEGHINVFDTDTYVWEGDSDYDTLEEFYAWLAAQPTAIGQFNHPFNTWDYDWNFSDFAYHTTADERMYLRETPGYPFDQYLLSLNQGWRVGASDGSDTHGAEWGRRSLMGLVAPNLTEDAVLEALRARRTFTAYVYDRNVAVVMQANGYWMGSVISNTTTINFTVTAYDPDPIDRILALVLYDNGIPVTATMPFSDAVLYTWTPSIVGSPGHYYYVKVYFDVDGWSAPAYTSPIWTETSKIPGWSVYLPMIMKDRSSGW
jgi:hypothetical protein